MFSVSKKILIPSEVRAVGQRKLRVSPLEGTSASKGIYLVQTRVLKLQLQPADGCGNFVFASGSAADLEDGRRD